MKKEEKEKEEEKQEEEETCGEEGRRRVGRMTRGVYKEVEGMEDFEEEKKSREMLIPKGMDKIVI